jgi:hypothetical protein
VQSACFSYAAAEDVWLPAAQMITPRCKHGMTVYKGLFVANHELHTCNWCAQVVCLSMADITVQRNRRFSHTRQRKMCGRRRHR